MGWFDWIRRSFRASAHSTNTRWERTQTPLEEHNPLCTTSADITSLGGQSHTHLPNRTVTRPLSRPVTLLPLQVSTETGQHDTSLLSRYKRISSPLACDTTQSLLSQAEPASSLLPISPTIQERDLGFVNSPYMIPRDVHEINRLDAQHFALRQILVRNYSAPLRNPRSVLDVGTGTGRWAIEMATHFQDAHVVGLDVLMPPPLPVNAEQPNNYMFVRGNVLAGLPFQDASFDFVHQRFVLFHLLKNRLGAVGTELARVTRTGGWIELVEAGAELKNSGPATKKMTRWAIEQSLRQGIDPRMSSRLGEMLHSARLVNIEVYSFDVPVGRWGDNVGRTMASNLFALAQGMKHHIVTQSGVSPAEYDRTSWIMKEEWEQHRSLITFHIAYGQER